MLHRYLSNFYWPDAQLDIERWCRECDTCARRKLPPRPGKARLQNKPVGAPLDRIAMDILGPLPMTTRDNQYILVVGCYFSKWTEAYALPNHTAETVADVLMRQFICRFGIPLSLHTDQGREFDSEIIRELCRLLGITKSKTVSYRPQSDGLIERMNRTVLQMLSAYVNNDRDDWDEHLPYVMSAYRGTRHNSTGNSPNLVMLG